MTEDRNNDPWGSSKAKIFHPSEDGPTYDFKLSSKNGERPTAHTAVIAPTGSGKTVMTNFMVKADD